MLSYAKLDGWTTSSTFALMPLSYPRNGLGRLLKRVVTVMLHSLRTSIPCRILLRTHPPYHALCLPKVLLLGNVISVGLKNGSGMRKCIKYNDNMTMIKAIILHLLNSSAKSSGVQMMDAVGLPRWIWAWILNCQWCNLGFRSLVKQHICCFALLSMAMSGRSEVERRNAHYNAFGVCGLDA